MKSGTRLSIYIALTIFALFLYAAGDTLSPVPEEQSEFIEEENLEQSQIYILNIEGAIGTVVADMVIDAVGEAEDNYAELLIIRMDTPGGFVTSIWPITKAIMNSRVPVAVYVAPAGAKAASAGVFITYAAHIAAMAPSTNIGAAHVVAAGGQMDSVMTEKVTKDALASLRAMAERHNRNADWAAEAVKKSESITAQEALELNVINLIADDIDDLIGKVHGETVNTVEGEKTIRTTNPVKVEIEKTAIQSILEIITDPNVVFILLSLGGLGLVMELYNPGAIFPGVFGGICIIVAFYGMRTLPINYAGIALILFAIILFILEIKVVSHGILTVGGVVSLGIGGMMLIDTADPDLRISTGIIISVALVIGGFIFLAFWLALKARLSRPMTGNEGLVGLTAEVKQKIDKKGYVFLAGELWEALADEVIDVGEQVVVTDVENLKVKVRKKG